MDPTPEEAKAIVAETIAYFGTYTVDEAKKIIHLHLVASTFANQLGSDQDRTIVSLTPSDLTYKLDALSGGQIVQVWKRAQPVTPTQ